MQTKELKYLENEYLTLEAAISLHFFHYNFMRLHQTLRVTPAMEAGISKHLWTWEEFLGWGKQLKEVA